MKKHALKRSILVLLRVLLPAVCACTPIPVPDDPTMFLCFSVYFITDEEKTRLQRSSIGPSTILLSNRIDGLSPQPAEIRILCHS